MATVADSLYVVVGYKLDDASAKRVEKHFERMRNLAYEMARDANSAAGAMRYFGKTADKAIGDAQRATEQAVKANDRLKERIDQSAKATQTYERAVEKAATKSEDFGKKASIGLATVAGGLTAIGAVGAGILTSLFGRFEQSANEIVRLAAATNTSVEAFSSLAFVAKSSGVEVDDLRDGLNDLSEKAGEAYTALKEGKKDNEYLKVFRELNIEVGAFTKLKPDQRFEQFADALNRVQDPGRRSAIVMKLMSDEGTKFNLIFNKGTKEIQRMRAEAQAMGATLGTDAAKNLTSYNTALARFEARITALANRLGAEALPLLTDALNTLLSEVGVKEIREIGDGLVDMAKGFHSVAMPAIKDMLAMARAVKDLIKDLGGLGNALKLVAIGILALKAPGLIAAWGAQAAAVATFGKALAGLVLSLGASGSAMALVKLQLVAMGKAAAVTAGRMALVAIPLLIWQDYAEWGSGGDSLIGHMFGAKTQENIGQVHNALGGVGAVLALIAGLTVGIPAGLAAALGGLLLYMYGMRQEFEDFFFNLTGLIGIYVQRLLDGVKSVLRGVFVDLPTALGEGLNERLSFLGRLGSSGGLPASAMSPVSDASRIGGSRTVNSNQEINVNVDARGATDPSAVGAASAGGVQDAARQLNTQYDSGVL